MLSDPAIRTDESHVDAARHTAMRLFDTLNHDTQVEDRRDAFRAHLNALYALADREESLFLRDASGFAEAFADCAFRLDEAQSALGCAEANEERHREENAEARADYARGLRE